MAGGFHSTSPLYHSVALVARVTSKLPSALQTLILLSSHILNSSSSIISAVSEHEIANTDK